MARLQQITSRTFNGSKRVLVVEDDVIARMILARWFDRWEIGYDMFASPAEVMSRLSHNPYCLALIDYHLPYMNGLELVREMRSAAKRYRYQPPSFAIHTTDSDLRGYVQNEDVEWFLVKPVPHARLASVLSETGCKPALIEDPLPAHQSMHRQNVRAASSHA